MILFFKSHVKGHLRGGKFVSEYDRSPGVSGRQHLVPIRPSVFSWSGVKPGRVYADYVRLSRKHVDQLPDARSAMNHVEWVLEHPHVVLPATDSRFMMFIRRGSVDKVVVLEPNVKHGSKGYSVRSAYILDDGQVKDYITAVMKKMKGGLKMRKALSAGTPSPGVLSGMRNEAFSVIKVPLPMPHGMVQLSEAKFNPNLSIQ